MIKPKDKLLRKQFMLIEINRHVTAREWENNKPVTLLPTTHNTESTNTVHERSKAQTTTQVDGVLLSSNFNQFTKAVKDFLQLHSFYTLAEYLNYKRN
jgi:negative regulator of replication initiation